MSNTHKLADLITIEDTMAYLRIPVNEQALGVTVVAITMAMDLSDPEQEPELAVNWESSEVLEDSEEANDIIYNQFYGPNAGEFGPRLRELLIAAGFSADAAYDVSGSESGMQMYGRASYDAPAVYIQALTELTREVRMMLED